MSVQIGRRVKNEKTLNEGKLQNGKLFIHSKWLAVEINSIAALKRNKYMKEIICRVYGKWYRIVLGPGTN